MASVIVGDRSRQSISGRALLVAGQLHLPASHQLVKQPGQVLQISWGVKNNGSGPGISRLWLYALGNGGLVVETTQVQIPPGASVSLPLSWVVDLPRGSTHTMFLVMADQSPGATDSLADHQFTIQVN